MQDDMHPIDQWDDESNKSQAEFEKQALLETSLLFSVFSTPSGKQLIERWKDHLMYSPTAKPTMNTLSIGINEGQKTFIRSILQAIKTHEDSQ
jgi:hypothetical protein